MVFAYEDAHCIILAQEGTEDGDKPSYSVSDLVLSVQGGLILHTFLSAPTGSLIFFEIF
jgi:hypothetical protein